MVLLGLLPGPISEGAGKPGPSDAGRLLAAQTVCELSTPASWVPPGWAIPSKRISYSVPSADQERGNRRCLKCRVPQRLKQNLSFVIIPSRDDIVRSNGTVTEGAMSIVHMITMDEPCSGNCAGDKCFRKTIMPNPPEYSARHLEARAGLFSMCPQTTLHRLSYSTRGTSMWMSMRSNSGPEIRFW